MGSGLLSTANKAHVLPPTGDTSADVGAHPGSSPTRPVPSRAFAWMAVGGSGSGSHAVGLGPATMLPEAATVMSTGQGRQRPHNPSGHRSDASWALAGVARHSGWQETLGCPARLTVVSSTQGVAKETGKPPPPPPLPAEPRPRAVWVPWGSPF